MTKKQDLIARFLDEYQPRWKVPEKPIEGFDLLEHGMMLILNEHLTPNQAEATVKALRAADQDWNELRVSQSQEIAQLLRDKLAEQGLESKVYGNEDDIGSNAIEFLIHGLRKKLSKDSIKNIRGLGWMVEP